MGQPKIDHDSGFQVRRFAHQDERPLAPLLRRFRRRRSQFLESESLLQICDSAFFTHPRLQHDAALDACGLGLRGVNRLDQRSPWIRICRASGRILGRHSMKPEPLHNSGRHLYTLRR